MKSPFRYQSTGSDCYPTSVVNALTALYPFRDIPPVVLKHIYMFSLDEVSRGGALGDGTSDEAGTLLTRWLGVYRTPKFKLDTLELTGVEVHLGPKSRIVSWLSAGGVVVATINLTATTTHSVLIVDIDKEHVKCWDPLPRTGPLKQGGNAVAIPAARQQPNLKVKREWFDRSSDRPYTLGRRTDRHCLLLRRAR